MVTLKWMLGSIFSHGKFKTDIYLHAYWLISMSMLLPLRQHSLIYTCIHCCYWANTAATKENIGPLLLYVLLVTKPILLPIRQILVHCYYMHNLGY